MNAKELRQLAPDAFRAKAEELRTLVRQMSYAHYQQKEKNVKKLQTLRHELARALTVLSERESMSPPTKP